eukprot:GEMP01060297.1.p1 GENE.GEMP01060297.1~~GEMP01060297.1.p1  ORF type:complete len:237 (-),score=39.32 GEMP01060297.1:656-1366(-)
MYSVSTRVFAMVRPLCTSVPAMARVGEYSMRIENKIGVGLRYRRPRVWDGTQGNARTSYSEDDLKKWRKDFNLVYKSHSLGQSDSSYTNDELMEWRAQFDAFASNDHISLANFHKLVEQKCTDLRKEELPSKVMQVWKTFDEDKNNVVDFGEFMKAGLNFDLQYMKEKILRDGVQNIFTRYMQDGFISEGGIFQMMQDFNFFVTTTSDMRKVIKILDLDKDGMVSKSEWEAWFETQ